MVNGLHLYSAFRPNGHQSALHIASHSPTAVSAIQGAIQLVGSRWG